MAVNGEPGSNIEDLIPRTGPFCVASIIELVLIFSVAFPAFLFSFSVLFRFSIKTSYRFVSVTRKHSDRAGNGRIMVVRILSMALSKARLLRVVRIVLSVRSYSRGSMLEGIS